MISVAAAALLILGLFVSYILTEKPLKDANMVKDAHTTKQCLSRESNASILSWPTFMPHYKQMIVIFTA
eukprot:scaffold21595_cov162-Skeletonema_dohrnii-CCMP3373.AAC.3